jgi:hypothetical protein
MADSPHGEVIGQSVGVLTDRQSIRAEFEGRRATFHALFETASAEVLARPSNGTRWTNRELPFHMMFGYMVVRALLPLVKFVSRLPEPVGRGVDNLTKV